MHDSEKRIDALRVTVMGLGHFGGGIGVAKYYAGQGARVTVTDMKTDAELVESLRELEGLDIRYVLGRHEMEDFTDTDMVVVSPAVPRESPYILAARGKNIPLKTEIGLFLEHCPALVCAVTGSNGKTTTVSMLGAILDHDRRPHWTGGNIGGSLLSALPKINDGDIVVLELSSFQLEWLRDMKWHPHIAVVLNVKPNHLDRHGTFEAYHAAKQAIVEFQRTTDIAVLFRNDPGSSSMSRMTRAAIRWIGEDLDVPGYSLSGGVMYYLGGNKMSPLVDMSVLKAPGRHMAVNAMAAAVCAIEMGVRLETITEALAGFHGLPHRLELVGERDGVRFFNDSKATTPEAASAGIGAFDGPVCVILGGYDKHVTFEGMAKSIAGRVKLAALIGETAPQIASALDSAGIPYTLSDSLEQAFEACTNSARRGYVVLLSPGCASYDMFANYEERGDEFRRLAAAYIGNGAAVDISKRAHNGHELP